MWNFLNLSNLFDFYQFAVNRTSTRRYRFLSRFPRPKYAHFLALFLAPKTHQNRPQKRETSYVYVVVWKKYYVVVTDFSVDDLTDFHIVGDMTPTNEPITTEELRALIELYRRMKMRVDDKLTDLQREYDVRVSVLNDETRASSWALSH